MTAARFFASRWGSAGAALLLGLPMRFAFAPYGFWPLAFLMPAGLLWLAFASTPRRAFALGWWFGLSMFALGTSWVYTSVHGFGGVVAPVAVLGTLLFAAVLGLFSGAALALATWISGTSRARWLLLAPACWVLLEWVKSWFLSGFPWLSLGYSQTDTPIMALAPWSGVFGMSLVVMLVAAALHGLCSPASRRRALSLLGTIAVGLGAMAWTGAPGAPSDTLRVVAIQGNFAQDIKWLPQWRQRQLQHYAQGTLALKDVDLVVWPETAIPGEFNREQEGFFQPLDARARRQGISVIGGVIFRDARGRYFNAAVAQGAAHGLYRKERLVPLGEFFPFKSLLRLLPGLSIPMNDLSPGPAQQGVIRAGSVPVDVSICYEDAFGDLLRRNIPRARLLVNLSNDAWFGRWAPYQHLQMARLRAAELHRAMVRATNTGVSALIGADGRLIEVAAPFQAVQLRGEVPLYTDTTAFARFGNAPLVALLLLVLLLGKIQAGGIAILPGFRRSAADKAHGEPSTTG